MRLFADDDFQFGFEMVLGGGYRQATDAGEVVATAERIEDGDADGWVREWEATAERALGAGETARHAGRRVTALAFYRRAATYYSTALYCAAKADSCSSSRELAIWRRHRACWEHVVDLSPAPGERTTDPLRGHDARGLLLPRAGRRTRRAKAAGDRQQRQRRRDLEHVGTRRGGRGRARVPLDDLRRSRPAARALRAGHPVPPRLGGGAHARAGRPHRSPGRRARADRRDRRQSGWLSGCHVPCASSTVSRRPLRTAAWWRSRVRG